jgi:HSP20 family molecular chaperone IbpA
VPVTDVFVRDEDLMIRVELPGIDPATDVTVSVEDGHLVIRGERKQEGELKEEAYYRLETAYGTFERFIPLPEGFDQAEIESAYEDGVLEVIVPAAAKALEPPKPRTIPIKTALPTKAAKVAQRGYGAALCAGPFSKKATRCEVPWPSGWKRSNRPNSIEGEWLTHAPSPQGPQLSRRCSVTLSAGRRSLPTCADSRRGSEAPRHAHTSAGPRTAGSPPR